MYTFYANSIFLIISNSILLHFLINRVWLGVELDRPKGNCDGSSGEIQYFKCRPNHGVFVYPSKVTKISDSTDRPSSGSSCASPTSRPVTTPTSRKKHAASPIIRYLTKLYPIINIIRFIYVQ